MNKVIVGIAVSFPKLFDLVRDIRGLTSVVEIVIILFVVVIIMMMLGFGWLIVVVIMMVLVVGVGRLGRLLEKLY